MSATPAQLNHYRILEPLGKGGMGEVYLGEDTRLHRKVAIKVLPGLMSVDAERRHRFEREAQAVAAINHPNIVTIHAVEESDGLPFIVMELVEGRTLADAIGHHGLPLDLLLRVGIAVSDAIATAHQRGITHRDLKPANVMVTQDGRVKVLDFGLAKLREPEMDANGVTRMPASDLTGEGRIIGTVAYMSPEQAEGKPVDQRSDIFSLGVMLHEMAIGERPFKGDTNVSIISSILKDTPSSITDLNPALPADLARIVRRALAKDPSRRYQTATDLRNELEELKQTMDSGATATATLVRPVRRTFPVKPVVAAAALMALAAAAFVGYRGWRDDNRPAGFEVDRFTRLTTTGNALIAAISGDGRYIVHIKLDQLRPSLWIRQTATLSDVQIVPAAPVRYKGVSFSPDGNYVYYVTYEATGGVGTLYKVPALGGTPQRILEDVDSRISFSPNRQQFAFMRGVPTAGRNYVMIANADGSGVRQLATVEPPDQFLLNAASWSPDGTKILTSAQSLREGPHLTCFVVEVATGASQNACGRWGQVNDVEWMPGGGAFMISSVAIGTLDAQLWEITYPGGERRRITNDLNNYTGISLTTDGRSIATVQVENNGILWMAPGSDPMKAVQITSGRARADGLSGLSWLPDNRLLFSSTASGSQQIWITDADGQNQRPLTNDREPAVFPAASPDGRFIVYQQIHPSGMYLVRMDPDGSNRQRITDKGGEFQPLVGPDNRTIFFMSPTSGQSRPFKLSLDGGPPAALAGTTFRPTAVSPDGRLLLGVGWDEPNRRASLATMAVDGGTPEMLNLPVLTGSAAWTKDGKGIVYIDLVDGRLNLWVRDVAGGKPRQLTQFTNDNLLTFAWSRDGAWLALVRGNITSDVVMISAR
jgi:eukaryotic-like serine/threonine-protein kinase